MMAINRLLHNIFNIPHYRYSVEGEHYITYFSTILLLELEKKCLKSPCAVRYLFCVGFWFSLSFLYEKNKVNNTFIVYCCI